MSKKKKKSVTLGHIPFGLGSPVHPLVQCW